MNLNLPPFIWNISQCSKLNFYLRNQIILWQIISLRNCFKRFVLVINNLLVLEASLYNEDFYYFAQWGVFVFMLKLWDTRMPSSPPNQYMGHNGPTFAIDWHPEEKTWVASAGRDKMVKVMSTSNLPAKFMSLFLVWS